MRVVGLPDEKDYGRWKRNLLRPCFANNPRVRRRVQAWPSVSPGMGDGSPQGHTVNAAQSEMRGSGSPGRTLSPKWGEWGALGEGLLGLMGPSEDQTKAKALLLERCGQQASTM